MSLVPFGQEEQVTVFGETLTLRLDFRAITGIEGQTNYDMPTVSVICRMSDAPVSILGQVIWFLLREHHPDVTLDQVAGIMFDQKENAKLGVALDALLSRVFPLAEDKKPKNAPKPHGRSRSSDGAGLKRGSTPKASGEKVPEPS